MIEAEMYGMIPSAQIESCSSAPPENMLNIPRNDPEDCAMMFFITDRFTPGTVTKIITR
jgi:hypothetical protein